MSREKLIEVINDTIHKCENEYSWMIKSENIYYNEKYFKVDVNNYKKNKAIINIVKQTTVEALQSYGLGDTYAVLNFASAKHPGGGVLKGTVAQEEALARASSLYPIIKDCTEFYNNTPSAPYYSDRIIYSTPIYVFKNDYGQYIEPIECEVITCAAPNYSFTNIDINKHKEIIRQRFTKVLMSAIENNQRNLLLGAWGCGVFKNPADINAQIFREVLDNYSNYFDDIIFAIPDDTNYEIFKENLY